VFRKRVVSTSVGVSELLSRHNERLTSGSESAIESHTDGVHAMLPRMPMAISCKLSNVGETDHNSTGVLAVYYAISFVNTVSPIQRLK